MLLLCYVYSCSSVAKDVFQTIHLFLRNTKSDKSDTIWFCMSRCPTKIDSSILLRNAERHEV